MTMMRGSVVSFDWFKSPEGQGLLAHLTDPSTGYRKLYGVLEQPNLPPNIEQVDSLETLYSVYYPLWMALDSDSNSWNLTDTWSG